MKSIHSITLETMIKAFFGIGVIASVFAIPSPPEPEQVKVTQEPEPVEEILIEEETWKCPSCTPKRKSCSSSITRAHKDL